MLKSKRSAILFIIIFIIAFYSWLFIYRDNLFLRELASSSVPLIGGTIGTIWLFRVYKSNAGVDRNFSRLLIMGMFFYLLSNCNWLFVQIEGQGTIFPKMAHFIWLIAYVFFLIAIVYKLRKLESSFKNAPIFYNIGIFMITLIALSIHYVIIPIMEISNMSISMFVLKVSYPIIDLLILFAIINLYYLSRYTRENKALLTISIGFLIQVIADGFYSYLIIQDIYQVGNIVDVLWMLAILTICFSSFYVQESKEDEMEEMPNYYSGYDGIILNISVIILTVIVIYNNNWHWNILVVSLILTLILIIVRKYLIIRRNRGLLDKLEYQAYHDELTGLNNRSCFKKDMEKMMFKAEVNNSNMAILLLDLDRFKNVNDTLGHNVGDYLLKSCSKLLRDSVGEQDQIYRIGGDEFTIILPNGSKQYCTEIANNVLESFNNKIVIENYEISITPSIGIGMYPNDGENGELLLKSADAAMYQAKSKSGNNFEFYNAALNEVICRRMEIENKLYEAIENDELLLYYQPKFNLATKQLVGMEALLRWNHPELGFICPTEFIPIAEETGQIFAIGEWVLNRACKQTKLWQDAGYRNLRVSVNVSVRQFEHFAFLDIIKQNLQDADIEAKYLEIEITESIMQNIVDSTRILKELRAIGVKIAIDDFGTGYSSLFILKKLPIDVIKIDKCFIDDISTEVDKSLVDAIIDIGLTLNLEVIIEGVETEEQVQYLIKHNQTILGQGYLFSKPIPVELFEEFMSTSKFI